MGIGGQSTLVLNASFEPLNVVSWERAIQLLFQGKVEIIEESDRVVRSIGSTLRVPAILRLLKYIPLRRAQRVVRFSRANVFIRDAFQCQYCAGKPKRSELTLDHVIPIVQGGGKTWENIVTCCKTCNQKKGGRTPKQAGLRLRRKPKHPSWLSRTNVQISLSFLPDSWKVYFYPD